MKPATLILLISTTFLQSETLHVDPAATGSADGSSWGDAYAFLQDAMVNAVSGDVIYVAEGIYYPDEGMNQVNNQTSSTFALVSGVEIFGRFPTGGGVFADRDPSSNETILAGDLDQTGGVGVNATYLISATDLDAQSLIDGFAIVAGGGSGRGRGRVAALICTGASGLEISNCNFLNYSGSTRGAINASESTLHFTGCSFSGNGSQGGGTVNLSDSTSAFVNCSFTDISGNSLGRGGPVHLLRTFSSFANCLFTGNVYEAGGAIFSSESTSDFENCSFQGNASTRNGGAIYLEVSSITLGNCSLQGNSASQSGGALFSEGLCRVELTNSIIWKNSEGSDTTTAGASVFTSHRSADPIYTRCIVQNIDLTSEGKECLDGTDPANNPLFATEVDPLTAPTTGGDLRLGSESPAIDTGERSASTTEFDLAGRPRVSGRGIDLGAYEVQNTLYVRESSEGSGDGSSWSNAFTSLQDALASAVTGQSIFVAHGSYFPDEGGSTTDDDRSASFVLLDGVRIYGGFPPEGGDFHNRSLHDFPTILSGDIDQNDASGGDGSGNAYHVLTASDDHSDTTIDGFFIKAGNANGAAFSSNSGGGILCSNSANPTISNCVFQANAAVLGGAMALEASSPRILGCSFLGNSAEDGGAIASSLSSPSMINCAFIGNHALDEGGAIRNSSSVPSLINCSFQGNAALFGGAVSNHDSSPEFINCIAWNNAEDGETGSVGSSVFNAAASSSPTYHHCLFQNMDLSLAGDGNLDGSNPTNDPLFTSETDPLSAPTIIGDLSLQPESPAIDAGDLGLVSVTVDLNEQARVQDGAIDLGPYEHQLILHFVRKDSTGSGDGSSWEDAFPTLRDALGVADAGDQIHIAEGVYDPNQGVHDADDPRSLSFDVAPGVSIYGGFPPSGGSLAERDPGNHPCVLSGDIDENDSVNGDISGNSYHVMRAVGSGPGITIDGLIVVSGNADGAIYPDDSGGGILIMDGASLTTVDCLFQNNIASNDGGAVSNDGSSFSADNCTFASNAASDDGGAFYNSYATASFSSCTFNENQAPDDGGAICSYYSTANFDECLFSRNLATGSDAAGGAFIDNHSVTNFTNCTFRENDCAAAGGAAFIFYSHTSFVNCLLEGNHSTRVGGAIFKSWAVSLSLTNCSIQGNAAGDNGGGVHDFSEGRFLLTNCSLQGNSAGTSGGAVYSSLDTYPTMTNCIIWNNAANGVTSSYSASLGGSYWTNANPSSHNLIQFSSRPLSLDGTDPNNAPRFLTQTDPLSAPASGGDLRLLPNSPAVDFGKNSANTTTSDLGNRPRIQNLLIDLGAYEGVVDAPQDLWPTDLDRDGVPYGVELALGTDPDLADSDGFRKFTFQRFDNSGGQLSFGRGTDAPDGTVWIVERSTTLEASSFETIYRFNGNDVLVNETGNTFEIGPELIQITDLDPPAGKAFYVFRAELEAP